MNTNSFRRRFQSGLRRMPLLFRFVYMAYRLIQPKYSVGVVAVVINDRKQFLLVEHAFHPELPWGLPGGWIGRSEDPEVTIKRELHEELGIESRISKLLLLNQSLTMRNHLDIAFLCETDQEIAELSYELLDYRWYNFDDASIPRLHTFQRRALAAARTVLKEASTESWHD